MAEAKFIYKIDTTKKKIFIDTTVTPSAADNARYIAYLSAGYTDHVKSQKKAKIARDNAKKSGFGKKKEEA